jgi:hypothetical protein
LVLQSKAKKILSFLPFLPTKQAIVSRKMEGYYVYETGDPDGYRFDHDRFLAAAEKDEPTRIDYSVLSVAVMTLGLVMMVEVFRHRLDHAAMGRPFFTAVLEGVYAECKYPLLR